MAEWASWVRDSMRDHERSRAEEKTASRYQPLEPLGQGGMAIVLRAWDRSLNRPVALKTLREELATRPDAVKRFQREALTLAKLSHPNIVTVYDVVDEDGRVQLVMELVDGEPLDRLMPGAARDLPRYVRLLAKVARGVHHVHQHGIVHRDLKPANILVTPAGEPKVTDFGLAHLAYAESAMTRAGALLGTPVYMAPEQIGGRPDAISARTDVHALGAILYEMCVGAPPFVGESPESIYRQILEVEPEPPHRRNPRIPRDLETIALKSLSKDPSRRYASAGAFSDDLERFLANEPIRARPPSLAYMFTKQLRRHPVGWAGGTLALVALSLAAVAIVQQAGGWGREAESRKREEDRRRTLEREVLPLVDRARMRIQAADRMQFSPEFSFARWQETLTEARMLCDDALARHPGFAMAFLERGRARHAAGDWDAAIADFTDALRIDPRLAQARLERARARVEQVFANEHRVPAGSETEATSGRSRDLLAPALEDLRAAASDRLADDERALAEILRLFLEGSAEAAIATASAKTAAGEMDDRGQRLLGEFHHRQKHPKEMVQAFETLVKRRPGDAMAWARYGHMLCDVSEYPKAAEAATRALKLRPGLVEALADRGLAQRRMGQWEAALEDYDEALRLRPSFVTVLAYRAALRRDRGEFEAAARDVEEALRIDPEDLDTLGQLGMLKLQRGDLDGALAVYDGILKIKGDYATAYANRAEIHRRRGDAERALLDCDRAIELDPRYYEAFLNRGAIRLGLGQLDLAIEDWTEAIRVGRNPAKAYANRGVAHRKAGRNREALDDYTQAIALDPTDGATYYNRGVLHEVSRAWEPALADYAKATELAPKDPDARRACARVCMVLGRWQDAERHVVRALELVPGDPELASWLKRCRERS
jgi:tetratricopeptide (TPR) repeat protein/predicted Ser/Thr protein kinase